MDWKKIGKKMLFPPVWLMVILAIVSATALIAAQSYDNGGKVQ